jgi:hypothetical protein
MAEDETTQRAAKRRAVVEAVATMPMVAQGPCEDLFCPFSCGAEGESPEHDEDCPITRAKRLVADRGLQTTPDGSKDLEKDHIWVATV